MMTRTLLMPRSSGQLMACILRQAQHKFCAPQKRVVLRLAQHRCSIECLELDTCVFEVKEGLFVSHKEGGILE